MLIIDNNISLILKNMVGRKCNGAHLDNINVVVLTL